MYYCFTGKDSLDSWMVGNEEVKWQERIVNVHRIGGDWTEE